MYVQCLIIKLRLRNFPFIVTLDMTILQFGWKVPIYGQCLSVSVMRLPELHVHLEKFD